MTKNFSAFRVYSVLKWHKTTGVAEGLYEKAFYQDMKNALKPDGVMCCQGKCKTSTDVEVRVLINFCSTCFSHPLFSLCLMSCVYMHMPVCVYA